MTTIVGVQTTHGWVIAADGQTTSGDRPFRSAVTPKFVRRNEYTYAVAGKGSACDVATLLWVPPPPADIKSGGREVYTHIAKRAMPSLRDAFVTNSVTFDEGESFQMILAHRGWLFQIEHDLTVLLDDSGEYAVGSGAPYALGALAMGADPVEAIRVAARFDIWTDRNVEQIFETGEFG